MAELVTVARPYAKALFEIAKETPVSSSNWDLFLRTLKELVLDEKVNNFIKVPDLVSQQVEDVLVDLVGHALKRDLVQEERNFLKLICEEKRYDLLPSIYDDFNERLLAEQNIIRATIETAYELTETQEKMFVDALKRRFNQDVEITVTISPSLIGGAILKIDDLVIDGSILGRLNSMIRSMN